MCIFKKKLKIGQVWQKEEKDPFKIEKNEVERAEILNIQKRHVLYLWVNNRIGTVTSHSSTISLFRYMFGEFVSDTQ